MVARHKKAAGTLAFTLLMCAVAEWSFAAGMEAASVGLAQKLLWAKIEYLGAVSTPTLFMLFTLEYRQMTRFLTPRFLILYLVIPLAALVVTFTNDLHGLIWNSVISSPGEPNTLIYGHGVAFYMLIAYDYMLILLGIAVMLRTWIRSKQPYRRQTSLVVISCIFPIAAGITYSFGWRIFAGLDITPISFLFSGLIIALGVFQFRLFDLAPIARHVLVESMNDGILVLDAQDRIVDINPMAENIIGIPTGSALGKPIAEVLATWTSFLQRIKEAGEFQVEILSREDQPHYYDLHVTPLPTNGNKEPPGRLFAFRDVTHYRQTENTLAHQNEELRIIEKINLAITAGLDMQQTIKTLHEQRSLITVPLHYERGRYLTGTLRDVHERPGTIGDVIHTRKTIYLKDNIKLVTAPLNPNMLDEIRARSYIGIPLILREKVVGVMSIQSYRPQAYRESQIHMLERISVHAAIAIENARLYSEVQRLAIIDELTGIYNYRGLMEIGAREVERARRFNHPLSILFFDIDDFRNFNNKYSHSTGNLVLQSIVKHCRAILRSVDVFSRFGGDEFVAILPETDIPNAEAVARRINTEIASSEIETPHGNLKVTVSIGLAMLGSETIDLADLIEHANLAEHQAKKGQKSIVVVAR